MVIFFSFRLNHLLKCSHEALGIIYDVYLSRYEEDNSIFITQTRIFTVRCEECNEIQEIEFNYIGIVEIEEKQMGPEKTYQWNYDNECINEDCENNIYGTITVFEYPINMFSDEDIDLSNAIILETKVKEFKKLEF